MPPPHKLIGSCPGHGGVVLDPSASKSHPNQVSRKAHNVCTDRAHFHLALSRLGKTPMNTEEEMRLLHFHKLGSHKFPNRVFLMELGQLSVENRTRADLFVDDLGSSFFNGQKNSNEVKEGGASSISLPKLKPHKKRHNVLKKVNVTQMNKNLLDICDPSNDALRSILLEIDKEASLWIRKYFLQSPDVVVSDRAHFLELLRSWEEDPCEQQD